MRPLLMLWMAPPTGTASAFPPCQRAFIALRKPDESIEHDSNNQEPKLYERGKEIIRRRALRWCDIKQPTFPEKVCTAYACAEPIEEKPTGIETMKGPAESREICSGGVEEK